MREKGKRENKKYRRMREGRRKLKERTFVVGVTKKTIEDTGSVKMARERGERGES